MKDYIDRLKNSSYKDMLIAVIVISFIGTLSNKSIPTTFEAIIVAVILSLIFILIYLLVHIKK